MRTVDASQRKTHRPGPEKHVLLMTATITPSGSPDLVRTNPVDRLGDYAHALRFYLKFIDRPLYGIVFVENSNSNIGPLQDVVGREGMSSRVEFVANYGTHMYSERGRAYGEFKLLDHAIEQSQLLREATVVWKVTGRYIVNNLSGMIESAPMFDIYCDMKNRPMRWMDMRLIAWRAETYSAVLGGIADEIGGPIGEAMMRDFLPNKIRALEIKGLKIRFVQRFRKEPLVNGIRGYDNRNYPPGRNLVKFYVRSFGRILCPWYWI